MGNIADYIKEYGDASFEERPFSDVDGLAIAQFSYLKLDGAVSGVDKKGKAVTISELRCRKDSAEIFSDTRFAKQNTELFDAMCQSRRFRDIKLRYYVNKIDEARHSQFAAVTCFISDELAYIAFRGTDETIVGWREDFDMACHMPVKSQELSADYLNAVAKFYTGGLIVGGHSKGGNLAMYASMHCKEEIRKRIERIYNLDGPGFLPGSRIADNYGKVADRVRKIIPHASLVGLLLTCYGEYRVIESNGRGVLQHDPFTWIVEKGEFVTVEDVYQGWKTVSEILNRWMTSLSEEQLRGFVEELFVLLEASEAETLLDFQGEWKRSARLMMRAFRHMDKETKKALWETGKGLVTAIKEVAEQHRTK